MVISRLRWSGRLSTLAGWPRRTAALLCLALAVLSAFAGHGSPAPEHRSTVVVAMRALQPGTVLAAADLATARWPDGLVPGSAVRELSSAVGHTVAAAMTRGEPLTVARLLDTGMSAALEPGQVALTISLAGGNQAAILQAGALVDVYAAGSDAGYVSGSPLPSSTGRRLGTSLRVLAVLPAANDPPGSAGPSLVLAVDRSTAARLADAPAGQFLASLVPPS
ncbi:Flp pilus assembly protein CpaB [Jatrophihabitans sp.]|uniref:Flp pilus assembly protein CpaB n=1 Tax=Jatrophihabitans sp. TaxID=1932789 RepID=UPI002C45044B|nr:Flp pilus assembly protein CpaB [Jatrophihabitans sp.]